AARGRAPSSPPPAAEAAAHPTGERAPGARRGQDAPLPAGVLWSPDVRLDPGGDARALTMERGGAGAVRRVHVPPEPVCVLNGCSRRGRVAGFATRKEERQARHGGAGGL